MTDTNLIVADGVIGSRHPYALDGVFFARVIPRVFADCWLWLVVDWNGIGALIAFQ